jgi:thiamine pyrophosphate-dependent acetolactate synthase large subunit-like protein
MAMEHCEALEVLHEYRGQRIVITTMASIGIWHGMSDGALDFAYVPSAMGQASSLALGLAMSQPHRGVIAIIGDGSMLMNLGSLVTLARNPAEVFLIIVENGMYEVTGGQPTAGKDRVEFASLARAAGISRVYAFDSIEMWRKKAAEALSGPAPVVISLKVAGRAGQQMPSPPRLMDEQIARLRQALKC